MKSVSDSLQNVSEPAIWSRDKDGLHKRRGIWHYKLKIAGRWQEKSTHKKNYKEARKVLHQALQDQEVGRLPTELEKWPFEKAASEWLSARTCMVAPQTHRIDKERLKPLLAAFGGRRLSEITSGDVRGYQVRRAGQVGPRTVNLETKVLRMILKQARLWSRIADDYKGLPENTKGPGRALSPEEEKRLFETASKNPDWAVACHAALVAANTTTRACEIKGLKLSNVDLISRVLSVRRTSTKTDAGCRMIPLNETATWALAQLLTRANELGSTAPEHYILPASRFRHTKEPNIKGLGYDPTAPMRTWRTAWRSLTKRAGLPGLRFHDLRHHSITRLAEAGVAEQTLMAIAGHVSREMLEHYSHIRMQAKRDAVAALDSKKPTQANHAADIEQKATLAS